MSRGDAQHYAATPIPVCMLTRRLLAAATTVAALAATMLTAPAAHATSPHGDVALYVISYGKQITADESRLYASTTNKWLRSQGVPEARVDLSVGGFVSRSGKFKTGCDVGYALDSALGKADLAAMAALQKRHDTVVPVVLAPNKEKCWFAGQAWIGSSGILLLSGNLSWAEQLRVFRHELGHNLGLGHFSTLNVKGGKPDLSDVTKGVDEYGDGTSIMGRGTALTQTDRLLLGVLPTTAGRVATPQQGTYTIYSTGKRDRLLAIPAKNTTGLTLEYHPSRGVEARAISGNRSTLWLQRGTSRSLTRGQTVRYRTTTITVSKTSKKSATVRVSWGNDVTAPNLAQKNVERAWWGLSRAIENLAGGWMDLTATKKPVTVDHTTVPTFSTLGPVGDDIYGYTSLLPELTDDVWVGSVALTINDTLVYEADNPSRSLAPAGTTYGKEGALVGVYRLTDVPLYIGDVGDNTMTLTVADLAGNTRTWHYRFAILN